MSAWMVAWRRVVCRLDCGLIPTGPSASALVLCLALGLLGLPAARAQLVINDQLNGASSSYPWESFGVACLTAGDNTGSIPSCLANRRIAVADPVGQGALRLTDDNYWVSGWLISKFSLPANAGLEVTFTSVTYNGDNFGGHGADGLAFFLIDADRVPVVDRTIRLGATGGPLGYSDRPSWPLPGLQGGYLGVGIDESGYFSDPGDTGVGGPGVRPNSVAVRGAEGTGYRYLGGSTVPGSLAFSTVRQRQNAVPVTFNLSITRDARLNLSYSRNGGIFNPVLVNFPITQMNGALPSAFHFGFSASSGGGTNVHEILCFKAAGQTTSSSSAASNVVDGNKVQIGTQLYFALHHTDTWWGQLTAQEVLIDPLTKALSMRSTANWDAHCSLTGGACSATGSNVLALPPAARAILTYNGSVGIPFEWSRLSPVQQQALNSNNRGTAVAQQLVGYLRGERAAEGLPPAPFRARQGLLGDSINASPVAVGPARMPYFGHWADALYPQAVAPEGHSYARFSAATATRPNVVYLGANDGMLHGFRSGAYTAHYTFDHTAPNDGRELLAYLPQAALRTLASATPQLDYAGPQYAHNAYVDATPAIGDVFYQGAWHTWLVSGMGGGGNADGVIGNENRVGTGAIFALDVTQPTAFNAANAAQLVVGEWDTLSLQCTTDSATSRCAENLGNTYGTPLIRRLHDGNWAVIFGNGYNSQSQRAGIFILTIDSATGAKTVRYLDAAGGAPGASNGISSVTALDLDGDNVTDYLYAGDLRGNVWRFDLTSRQAANWKVRPQPLFQTGGAPISTALNVTRVKALPGAPRVVLNFGSGRKFPQTLTQAASFSAGGHALYGVWDWDMADWNQGAQSGRPQAQHAVVRSLPAHSADAPPSGILWPAQLHNRALFTNGQAANASSVGSRTVANTPVCWHGGPACASGSPAAAWGWQVDLPGPQEQVIYNSAIEDGLFVVSTTIPSVAAPLSCSAPTVAAGFTMALTADQGLAHHAPYFIDPLNPATGASGNGSGTNSGTTLGTSQLAGISLGGVGTPSFLVYNNIKYLVTQTASGALSLNRLAVKVNDPITKRVTWRQLR